MALDLGTLQIQIAANTGDAINRLDTVKSSAEDVEKHSNIKINVGADTSTALKDVEGLQRELSDLTIDDIDASVNVSVSGLNDVETLKNAMNGITSVSATATATVTGNDEVSTLDTLLNNIAGKNADATADAAVGADGLNNTNALSDDLNNIDGKDANATADVTVGDEELAQASELAADLTGIDGKNATARAEASVFGTDAATTLDSTLADIDSKDNVTASASATVTGEDETSALDSALTNIDNAGTVSASASATVSGEDEASALDSALIGIDNIGNVSVSATSQVSGAEETATLNSDLTAFSTLANTEGALTANPTVNNDGALSALNEISGLAVDIFNGNGEQAISTIMGKLDITSLLNTLGVNGSVVAGVGVAGAFVSVAAAAVDWLTNGALTGSVQDALNTAGKEFENLRSKTNVLDWKALKTSEKLWIGVIYDAVENVNSYLDTVISKYDDIATAAIRAGMSPEEMAQLNVMSPLIEMDQSEALKIGAGITSGWSNSEIAADFEAAGMSKDASTWENMITMMNYVGTTFAGDTAAQMEWFTSHGFSEKDYQAASVWLSSPESVQSLYSQLVELGVFRSADEIQRATDMQDLSDVNSILENKISEDQFYYSYDESMAVLEAHNKALQLQSQYSDLLLEGKGDSEEARQVQAELIKAQKQETDAKIALNEKTAEYTKAMTKATVWTQKLVTDAEGNPTSLSELYSDVDLAYKLWQENPESTTLKQNYLDLSTAYNTGVKTLDELGYIDKENALVPMADVLDAVPEWMKAILPSEMTYAQWENFQKMYSPEYATMQGWKGTMSYSYYTGDYTYDTDAIDNYIASQYGYSSMEELLAALPEDVAASFKEENDANKADLTSGDITAEEYYQYVFEPLKQYFTGNSEGWADVSEANQEARDAASDKQVQASDKQLTAANKQLEAANTPVNVTVTIDGIYIPIDVY